MNKLKMNTKNVLVSFLTIVTALFLVATVSASEGYTIGPVVVNDGVNSIESGETVTVEVWFTAGSDTYDSDVTVEVTIDGDDFKVSAETKEFDVLPNDSLKKTLKLEIPKKLDDKLYDDKVTLEVEIRGDEYRESYEDTLSIKRAPYDVAIKSISTQQTVKAGENFPVEIVLKDIGYNDLDDLYVTAKIPTLGIERSGYFGDLVALECDEDDEDDEFPWVDQPEGLGRSCNEDDTDTVSGKLYLDVPYSAKAGVYQLEVEVSNDDTTSTKSVQVMLGNDFEKTVFKSGNSVWIVNPTNNVVGYRIVAEAPSSVSDSVVFVPAGASKTITVEPNAEGEYNFNVNVFTMNGQLVETVAFTGTSDKTAKTETNPIVILTVVLAIIFIVLLIVLIVLIGKKPEKSGEFGESYY